MQCHCKSASLVALAPGTSTQDALHHLQHQCIFMNTYLPAVLLEKFKDKSAVVTRAAAEALDMMSLYSFTLPDVSEDVAAALVHQNPKLKESTGIWLANCTKRETKANVLKLIPGVVPAAVKCTDEGAPSIRDAAFSFLVQAAFKVGGGMICVASST